MNMELKDVLHLYGIGTVVFFDNTWWKVQQLRPKTVRLEKVSAGGYKRWNECNYGEIIRLSLRPLSDMTEDEANEYFNGKIPHPLYAWQNYGYTSLQRKLRADNFLWLLSKHFDLFGLIENGLAIYATTLQR